MLTGNKQQQKAFIINIGTAVGLAHKVNTLVKMVL